MIIHLGLHKTGTTYLQKEYFPYINKRYISDEDLSGYPKKFNKNSFNDLFRELIIWGIKTKYGDNVKIILSIRNKNDWTKSIYNQIIRDRYFKSYKKYEKEVNPSYFIQEYIIFLEFMFKENFYLFDYDKFKNSPQIELDKLSDFLDCKKIKYKNIVYNKSLKNYHINIIRLINLISEVIKIKILKINKNNYNNSKSFILDTWSKNE